MKKRNELDRSFVYAGFKKLLTGRYGEEEAARLWKTAGALLKKYLRENEDLSDSQKSFTLPAVALYKVLRKTHPEDAHDLMIAYGSGVGEKLKKVYGILSAPPGVPELIWKMMPKVADSMSSPKLGYVRRINKVSEKEMSLDILSCPYKETAEKLGALEACHLICAMDKVMNTGIRRTVYERTGSVAEGAEVCDYRMYYDRDKK